MLIIVSRSGYSPRNSSSVHLFSLKLAHQIILNSVIFPACMYITVIYTLLLYSKYHTKLPVLKVVYCRILAFIWLPLLTFQRANYNSYNVVLSFCTKINRRPSTIVHQTQMGQLETNHLTFP